MDHPYLLNLYDSTLLHQAIWWYDTIRYDAIEFKVGTERVKDTESVTKRKRVIQFELKLGTVRWEANSSERIAAEYFSISISTTKNLDFKNILYILTSF